MAAPNMLEPSTITGKLSSLALTTSAQTLVNNPAASGKLLRVVSVYVTNVDGTNAADLSLSYYPQDDIGGTPVPIASTVSVAADTALIVVDKESPVYLEEDRSLGAFAGVASDLVAIASYEEIS